MRAKAMSITLVPALAAETLSGNPVAGNLDELTAIDQFLKGFDGDSYTYYAAMQSVQISLRDLQSEAVSRVQAKVTDSLIPGNQSLGADLVTGMTALGRYAAEVDRIHQAAAAILSDVDAALANLRAHADAMGQLAGELGVSPWYSWSEGPPMTMPVAGRQPGDDESWNAGAHGREASQSEWGRHASQWQSSIAHIRSAQERWRVLVEQRQAAEGALAGALRETRIGLLLSFARGTGESFRRTVALGVSGEFRGDTTALNGAAEVAQLLGGTASASETAAIWMELERDASFDTGRLLEEYCFELADLNGLPFAARDLAGRYALDYALNARTPEHLGEAFVRMGFGQGSRSLADLRQDLRAIQAALMQADGAVGAGDTVQLVTLGQHAGATTAALSLGDLDEAATVGVMVSGMLSNVQGIAANLPALQQMRGPNRNTAMVNWLGYRSPGVLEEGFQHRADAGARELAGFLDGIDVQRSERQIDRFVGIGHSYGTNVLAEALKQTDASVDAYVSVGSAGITPETWLTGLGVEEIWVTQALGDGLAPVGQFVHVGGSLVNDVAPFAPRLNPAGLPGARVFSSGASGGGKAVTIHDLLSGDDAPDEVGYFDPDSTSLRRIGEIFRDELK